MGFTIKYYVCKAPITEESIKILRDRISNKRVRSIERDLFPLKGHYTFLYQFLGNSFWTLATISQTVMAEYTKLGELDFINLLVKIDEIEKQK